MTRNLADTAADKPAPPKLVYPNPFPLIDGPLPLPFENRAQIVARMASDLALHDAFRNEADAMRCLFSKLDRYRSFDVVRFVGDAIQVAMQEAVVAKEMSES